MDANDSTPDRGGPSAGIETWWWSLPPATRDWLIDHNGEPLPSSVVDEIVGATGGLLDPAWWAGEDEAGSAQLTDAACDWIEEVANGEHTEPVG